jgi:hypothetical protein
VSDEPRREFTAQECASIIGGVCATLLVLHASREAVIIALRWWLEHPSQLPRSPFDPITPPTQVPAPATRM